jgi:nitrogen regulatory protein P-II 1
MAGCQCVPDLVKVQAVIREQRLDAVVERLLLIGVRGLTVMHAKGAGPGKSYRAVFRGGAYTVSFVPRVLLEWYGPADEADAVMRAIARAGATGVEGDGKIFVEPVEDALRIRTGERGPGAI